MLVVEAVKNKKCVLWQKIQLLAEGEWRQNKGKNFNVWKNQKTSFLQGNIITCSGGSKNNKNCALLNENFKMMQNKFSFCQRI